MISNNSVFKYVNGEKQERIRIIDIIEGYIYLVNIDMNTSMPKKDFAKEIPV